MGHVLGAGTQLEHRQKLGAGINGQPEPLHLCLAAQPGAEFVQLDVWQMQMAEGPLMQGLCVFSCARQPGSDCCWSKSEDPRGR